MQEITYTGPDPQSPPVTIPGSSTALILLKDTPHQASDEWSKALLAAGPQFVATPKPKAGKNQ